jgi:hypothetical protein
MVAMMAGMKAGNLVVNSVDLKVGMMAGWKAVR